MQFGRRLYYDKNTGKILYDTGEMEGDIIRPSIEQEIESLCLKNADCIELEFGKYRNNFTVFPFFKIDLFKKDVIFFAKLGFENCYYNKQEIKKIYNKETIEKFYNDYYLEFNLGNLLINPKIQLKWYSLDEINLKPELMVKSWHYYYENDYLTDSAHDKTLLAQDIVKNGTYWPLLVLRNEEGIYVTEGNHRIISAKLLQLDGGWDDRKLLCIELEEQFYNFISSRGSSLMGNQAEYILQTPTKQKLPFVTCFGSTTDPNDPLVQEEMRMKNMILFDEDTLELTTDLYSELLNYNLVYPHWLRDIMYNYKRDYSEIIKPNILINDEQKWNKWAEEKKNVVST